MRALVQRVAWAQVEIGQSLVARIEGGLLVFLGLAHSDSHNTVDAMVEKLIHLRIFANDEGRFDRSVQDVEGSILIVSQFTLLGDCGKGRRPNFQDAAPPPVALELYQYFLTRLDATGVPIASGKFQEHMAVSSLNDGPVTIIIDLLS